MTTMRLANFQKAVNNTTTHYPIYIYIYTRTQVLRLEKKGATFSIFLLKPVDINLSFNALWVCFTHSYTVVKWQKGCQRERKTRRKAK